MNPEFPHIKQYNANYQVEDTTIEQAYLDQMLAIMSYISRDYHPVGDDYHCRGIAWVKTESGQNQLITTASVSGSHVEELLIKAMAEIYKHDFAVVKDGKFKVHRMYLDIEPCNGERYGKDHHCMKFFTTGRMIQLHNGKKMKVTISDTSTIYWNNHLPAKGITAGARSKEVEREECVLGVSMYDAFKTHNIFEKLYIADETGYKEFDIKAAIEAVKKRDEKTPKMKEVKEILDILLRDLKGLPFGKDTCALLIKYHTEKNENKMNLYTKAMAENWNLRQMIKNNLTLQDANAIEEIHKFVRFVEEKSKNTRPASLVSNAPKPDRKPVALQTSYSTRDEPIQKKDKEPASENDSQHQSAPKRPLAPITMTAAVAEYQDAPLKSAKRSKRDSFFKDNEQQSRPSSDQSRPSPDNDIKIGNANYKLEYRYRREDGPHQVVAFEDRVKNEKIYELTFNAEPKKGSFSYTHFRDRGVLILNCQFPPKSIVFLPEKMDCYIVQQDPSVQIKRYKGRPYQIIQQLDLEPCIPEDKRSVFKK